MKKYLIPVALVVSMVLPAFTFGQTIQILPNGVELGQATSTVQKAPSAPVCIYVRVNLRQGNSDKAMKDWQISALQNYLRNSKFYYPTTGYFGPLTEAAVKNFQKNNGVPATGLVGPLTRGVLIGLMCPQPIPPSAINVVSPKDRGHLDSWHYSNYCLV
jgi:hypothetical protein